MGRAAQLPSLLQYLKFGHTPSSSTCQNMTSKSSTNDPFPGVFPFASRVLNFVSKNGDPEVTKGNRTRGTKNKTGPLQFVHLLCRLTKPCACLLGHSQRLQQCKRIYTICQSSKHVFELCVWTHAVSRKGFLTCNTPNAFHRDRRTVTTKYLTSPCERKTVPR
jgi:hypothetical protein